MLINNSIPGSIPQGEPWVLVPPHFSFFQGAACVASLAQPLTPVVKADLLQVGHQGFSKPTHMDYLIPLSAATEDSRAWRVLHRAEETGTKRQRYAQGHARVTQSTTVICPQFPFAPPPQPPRHCRSAALPETCKKSRALSGPTAHSHKGKKTRQQELNWFLLLCQGLEAKLPTDTQPWNNHGLWGLCCHGDHTLPPCGTEGTEYINDCGIHSHGSRTFLITNQYSPCI